MTPDDLGSIPTKKGAMAAPSVAVYDAIYDLGGGPQGSPVQVSEVVNSVLRMLDESSSLKYSVFTTANKVKKANKNPLLSITTDSDARKAVRTCVIRALESMRKIKTNYYTGINGEVQILKPGRVWIGDGKRTATYTEAFREEERIAARANGAVKSGNAAVERLRQDGSVDQIDLFGVVYQYARKLYAGGSSTLPHAAGELAKNGVVRNVLDTVPETREPLSQEQVDVFINLVALLGERS